MGFWQQVRESWVPNKISGGAGLVYLSPGKEILSWDLRYLACRERIPTGLPVVQRKAMSTSVFTKVPFDLTAGLDRLGARILNLNECTKDRR